MSEKLLTRRWSTLTLLAASLGLSGLTYFVSRPAIAPTPLALAPQVKIESALVATEAEAHPAPTTVAESPDENPWNGLSAKARTPDSERSMVEYVQELATRDPAGAMSLALGEGNNRLRQILRNAVLRGWAAVAMDDASTWTLALPDGDRQVAMEAVFAGAARHPEAAAQLGRRLSAQDPERASEYGQFLITGLTAAGEYETAVRFASTGTSPAHTAWLNSTFLQWAAHQPETALLAYERIADPATRQSAFAGLVSGWAMADPGSLAAYAIRMAPGENRSQALSQALPQWVERDTVVASEWVNQLDANPDLDTGVASVATLTHLVNRRPEIAVGWAESISEPVLRANTLWLIAQQWARNDPAGIRRFLATTPELAANDRTALTNGLNPSPDS